MTNQERRECFILGWTKAWFQLPSYDESLRLAKAEAERIYPDVPEIDAERTTVKPAGVTDAVPEAESVTVIDVMRAKRKWAATINAEW